MEEAYNMSRLHAAVAKKNLTEIDRIVQSNASEEIFGQSDMWGRTPLIAAIQASQQDPALADIAMQLIRADGAGAAPDKDGRDAAHWAALVGHRPLVEELLKLNVSSLSAPDRWGHSLIHHAAVNGHEAVVDLLLDQRVAVDHAAELSQQTPLHFAAGSGHREVMQQLLLRGAPLDARDKLLRQPLHHAILLGHSDVSEALIQAVRDETHGHIMVMHNMIELPKDSVEEAHKSKRSFD